MARPNSRGGERRRGELFGFCFVKKRDELLQVISFSIWCYLSVRVNNQRLHYKTGIVLSKHRLVYLVCQAHIANNRLVCNSKSWQRLLVKDRCPLADLLFDGIACYILIIFFISIQ